MERPAPSARGTSEGSYQPPPPSDEGPRLGSSSPTSDYAELVLLPASWRGSAHGTKGAAAIVALRVTGIVWLPRKLDVVLMPPPLPSEEGHEHHDLQVLRERFVCVARRTHPLAKKRALTLSRFAAA